MHENIIDQPEKLIQLFGQHFVALFVEIDRPSYKQGPFRTFFGFSGILISVDGVTFYLTAGHILRDIVNGLQDRTISIVGAKLGDVFGASRITDYPIPFNLEPAAVFFILNDDLGLDFGLIALTAYYLKLLAANNVTSLFPENWERQHQVRYDSFIMMGLPQELTGENLTQAGSLHVSPTLLVLDPIGKAVAGIPKDTKGRFHARIPSELPFESIVGMSGGPIFGINCDDPMRYWIVAIQSSWLEAAKEVFGCPIQTIGGMIREELRKARQRSEG